MNHDPVAGSAAPLNAADRAIALPHHVAIIMDGNGRWAGRRGLPRTVGHRKGVEAVRRIVRHAGERGIRILTLYAFSRENWSRPKSEVNELMNLLQRYIRTDLDQLVEQGARVRVIGGREDLDAGLKQLIADAEGRTAGNDRIELVLAFNYGGRDEIARAAKRLSRAVQDGKVDPDEVNEAVFARFLDTGTLADPDLVIRTSGERRISNFLLWQSAYAEYVFPETLWPDFDEKMFDEALEDFGRRERRFGAVTIETAT